MKLLLAQVMQLLLALALPLVGNLLDLHLDLLEQDLLQDLLQQGLLMPWLTSLLAHMLKRRKTTTFQLLKVYWFLLLEKHLL